MTLKELQPQRVFKYFEEICSIPHGSGNMKKIADYCENFAKTHNLKSVRDAADNVIIYKGASKGYEDVSPIILQGHLDMVCQKNEEIDKDFLTDGIDIFVEGDFIKAKGTTLGADNGIAVSMILAILESYIYEHPAIEAVFTTDEEIGMIGAGKLDFSLLNAKQIINLDAEEDDTVTVSCAGGSDFIMNMPFKKVSKNGTEIAVSFKGLLGGHSGVEIHKGRINANILAGRFLSEIKKVCDARLISISGGDKANAIPRRNDMAFCVDDVDTFTDAAKNILGKIKGVISDREAEFDFDINVLNCGSFECLSKDDSDRLSFALNLVPNGVQQMSADIEGLVETSLNLGILKTEENNIFMQFALRSNKQAELEFLEQRLLIFANEVNFKAETFGHYPPWEYRENSGLQSLYKKCYKMLNGRDAKVEAIHAGLECGLFAKNIQDIDCIAIGPQMYDVHTSGERLSISSTQRTFMLLLDILKNCK